MLSKSRRTRNTNNTIRLIQPHDILSVDRVLGSGAFSQVSAVTVRGTNENHTPGGGVVYACKHLQRKLLEDDEAATAKSEPFFTATAAAASSTTSNEFQLAAAELAYEAHLLSSFDHPHIIKIRGWTENGVAAFQNGSHDSFFLLLDLLQETLEQRIERWRKDLQQEQQQHGQRRRRRPGLQAQEQEEKEDLYHDKVRIMQEIGAALDYLHARGVIFRDLKPANIGFSAADTVQIFDFGLSRELPTLDTTTPFHMSGKVGTVRYMAPEVATTQPYTVSADVYSWSIVAYELLSLHKPYNGFTKEEHTKLVCQQGYRPDLRLGVVALDPVGGGETCSTTTTGCAGSIPSEMQALLQESWCTLPHHRWTMAQINSQLQQWLRRWNTPSTRRRRRTAATTASSSSSALLLKDCHPRPFFHEQQQQQQHEDPMPTPIGTHACIAGNHNNHNNTNVDECCYPRPFYHQEQHQQHQYEHRHYPHQMPTATATNTTPSSSSGNSSSHNSFYIDNLPSCSRMLDDKKKTYQDAAHHDHGNDHWCAVAATMVSNDQLGMSLGAMSFESIETINTTSWMMLHEENGHGEETAEHQYHPPHRRRVRARILSTDDDAGILPPSSSVCLDGGKLSAWYTQQQQHAAGYY